MANVQCSIRIIKKKSIIDIKMLSGDVANTFSSNTYLYLVSKQYVYCWFQKLSKGRLNPIFM